MNNKDGNIISGEVKKELNNRNEDVFEFMGRTFPKNITPEEFKKELENITDYLSKTTISVSHNIKGNTLHTVIKENDQPLVDQTQKAPESINVNLFNLDFSTTPSPADEPTKLYPPKKLNPINLPNISWDMRKRCPTEGISTDGEIVNKNRVLKIQNASGEVCGILYPEKDGYLKQSSFSINKHGNLKDIPAFKGISILCVSPQAQELGL